MTIQFYKVHKGINGEDSAAGECASIDDAKKQFADFLESHGTRCNDYDEFHCRFVDDSRGGEMKGVKKVRDTNWSGGHNYPEPNSSSVAVSNCRAIAEEGGRNER